MCVCTLCLKSERRVAFGRQVGIVETDVLCMICASHPCLCVCVCAIAIVSKVREGRVVFGKKNRCFDRRGFIEIDGCVRVSVCVLVCEDTALAYNTCHYRSLSVLREWVCSLSLQRQRSRKLPFAVTPNAFMLLCFFQLNITFLPHTNCHRPATYTVVHSRMAYVLMGIHIALC